MNNILDRHINHCISFIPVDNMVNEIWIPVINYPRYLISSFGRLFDTYNGIFCVSFANYKERYLYYIEINEYVHIAMKKSFDYFPGCENMYVMHKDGNTYCNLLDNLEWVNKPMYIKISDNSGENCNRTKYKETEIREVCTLLQKDKYTLKEIEKITGVEVGVIRGVKYGNTWKEITKDYKFNNNRADHQYMPYKHTDEQVIEICELLQNHPDMTITEIANKVGVWDTYVSKVANKIVRTDISCNYTWDDPRNRNTLLKNNSKKEAAKELLIENPNRNIKEFAKETGLSEWTIYDLRDKLFKAGKIKKIDHGKYESI